MNAEVQHTDVGAYALGLLEDPDRRAFEAHLSGCASCNAELAMLSGVAQALTGSRPEPVAYTPEPDSAKVADLFARRAQKERQLRRSRVLLSAAAGIVLAAGGATAGVALAGGGDDGGKPAAVAADGPRSLLQTGTKKEATDAASGVTGTVATEGKGWGTRVALQLSKVKGPLECELVAVDKAGKAKTVVGWSVPAKGYGVPGGMPPLVVQGGVAMQPSDIAKFEVRATNGLTLLTIPA